MFHPYPCLLGNHGLPSPITDFFGGPCMSVSQSIKWRAQCATARSCKMPKPVFFFCRLFLGLLCHSLASDWQTVDHSRSHYVVRQRQLARSLVPEEAAPKKKGAQWVNILSVASILFPFRDSPLHFLTSHCKKCNFVRMLLPQASNSGGRNFMTL